ncbi:hypothetical protein SUGI_0375570 [Cryptomeria japonica]|nr:hypothetical protein SUGI_0375570 [Cryptomeria japonica]
MTEVSNRAGMRVSHANGEDDGGLNENPDNKDEDAWTEEEQSMAPKFQLHSSNDNNFKIANGNGMAQTRGVASLAHPWALKNPVSIVRRLKNAGLHGVEVYRSDGKAAGFSELADAYGLLKIGGSDFHGRGDPDETDLGKVAILDSTMHEFLKVS